MMFDDRYEVVFADNEEARLIHYQVRYKVYCLEEGFEDKRQFEDHAERDEWDSHSVHFTVRCKQSGEWVAAMRMVLRGPGGLPIEQLCDIDPMVASSNTTASSAEISRLCIVDEHRRARHEPPAAKQKTSTAYPHIVRNDGQAPVKRQHHKSEIILGLLRAAVDYSYEHEIQNWYFLTTKALARIINRLCIQLINVGSPCQHNGVRHPFIANLKTAEKQATEGCSLIGEWRKRSTISYFRYSDLEKPATSSLVAQSLVA
jgi:N-acyl amino acid synthase of PEP-CTERM/exosortase system